MKDGVEIVQQDFLSPNQVRCAIALLNKSLPDLIRTTLEGPDGGAIPIRHEVIGIPPHKA